MLSTEQLKHAAFAALGDNNFRQFQAVHISLLQQYFPDYDYSSFRMESQRATRPLQNMTQVLAYQAFYGMDHATRFNYLLQKLPACSSAENQQPLTIFDYGCGQGLATLIVLHHLAATNTRRPIHIHLIEPSALALTLASAYVQHYAKMHLHASISTTSHQQSLDQLPDSLFKSNGNDSVIHLFSNVLDMAGSGYFNLGNLVQQWHHIAGKQWCLAVSPDCYNTSWGFAQLQHQIGSVRPILQPQSFSCESQGYRIGSYWRGLKNYTVQGKLMALVFKTNNSLPLQVA